MILILADLEKVIPTSCGFDYADVLGIEKQRVYSQWTGNTDGGRLFVYDKWFILPNGTTQLQEYEKVIQETNKLKIRK